jgi:hypothetical protein
MHEALYLTHPSSAGDPFSHPFSLYPVLNRESSVEVER